jgi:hypothetical protein
MEAMKSRLICPNCRSSKFKIKNAAGIERILVLFTNLRKYRCCDCGYGFRAPDRRSVSRQVGDAYAASRAAGILR